jgi:hypothetical protein
MFDAQFSRQLARQRWIQIILLLFHYIEHQRVSVPPTCDGITPWFSRA